LSVAVSFRGRLPGRQKPGVLIGSASVSDYERLVELAAKGMAERDNHPMPKFVTTPEVFYEVMARAAFDAADIPALLERATQAERNIETTQEAVRQADANTEHARHRR
jgi:hypothetical protein